MDYRIIVLFSSFSLYSGIREGSNVGATHTAGDPLTKQILSYLIVGLCSLRGLLGKSLSMSVSGEVKSAN